MKLFHLSTTDNIEQFLTNYEVFESAYLVESTETYVLTKVQLEDGLAKAGLTPKEFEVIDYKMKGFKTDEIAGQLNVTHNAVKKRVQKAYYKLIDFWLEHDYYDEQDEIDNACTELFNLESKWKKCGW